MQKAAFNIKEYKFEKFSLDLANHSDKELEIKFETSGSYVQLESKFELTFRAIVFNKGSEDRHFVDVTCKGLFGFDNVDSFDQIPDFFFRNSIALLFPYLRAYISLVTTQANVPGVILPTYNLTGLEELLRKNTIQL
jgi:preprotein translocase subunit SecB